MIYKVTRDFKDFSDGHEYKKGDIYPHSGEADKRRAEYLMKPTPMREGLLVEVEEKPKRQKNK